MRKLIYAINLSIDGCCDHHSVTGSDDILEYFANFTRDAGLLVYGRITYELMVPYWPDIAKNPSGQTKADVDYAQAFDSIDKIVFSQSLEKVEDKRTRIVRTDPGDEILKLKQESGKDILVGGVAFPSYLIRQGLVDEFYFVIHPVIAGDCRRLLDGIGLKDRLQLRLVESKILRSGCIVNRYSNC